MATPDSPQQPETARPAPAAVVLPRVLLVDDDADMVRLLAILLKPRGFSVTVAGSVSTALATLRSTPFDVLVSDINLPDGNGYDLLRQVRAPVSEGGIAVAAGATRPLLAIAMSGLDRDAEMKRALDAGFDGFLGKPLSVSTLVEALSRVLSD